MPEAYSIHYPRRVLIRGSIRLFGRGMLKLFTRITITGQENLPKKGPLLVVGNHVAMLEPAMMAICLPWLAEIIGTGDIPLEPMFARILNTYGIIPINRGNMDRVGLNMALDVLKQDGVVGIFPEGGIWDTSLKQGRTGVAWLSYMAQAPILPIGFGGMVGALGAAIKFQRPRVTMNIGPLIPAVTIDADKGRKQTFEDAANHVMACIESLLPEAERQQNAQISSERFDFDFALLDASGTPVTVDDAPQISHPAAMGQFFHRPVILSTFLRNLKLPVEPLQNWEMAQPPQEIITATQSILDYLEENPYFLTYRFGYEIGGAMKEDLVELRDLAQWADERGYSLKLNPIRQVAENQDMPDSPG